MFLGSTIHNQLLSSSPSSNRLSILSDKFSKPVDHTDKEISQENKKQRVN